VAVGHRVSWPDELLSVISLEEMAAFTQEHALIRTTLYLVSPALARGPQRSRLYSPDHDHLFRPSS
jgi:precorrin-4/cobalt-precorrin-4 C11-methyltransferase